MHVELTTLVVPGFNDDEADFSRIVSFIKDLDPSVPLHITRFFPAGGMKDAAPTKLDKLHRFYDIASAQLKNVFLGNV